MNINGAFPSKYLKASDLGDASPVVTISHVDMEKIGRDNDQKPVVFFKGKEKGLVLNKTNARRIAELLGTSETDEWEGGQIRIFATETEFAGETVECIRVKAVGPKNGHRLPEPVPEDSRAARGMRRGPDPLDADVLRERIGEDDDSVPF